MVLNTGHLDTPHANSYVNDAAKITYKVCEFIRKKKFPTRLSLVWARGGLNKPTRRVTPRTNFRTKSFWAYARHTLALVWIGLSIL